MQGHDLYPIITPSRTGTLQAGSLHQVYWEECGNPVGVPILFIHGGPGAGCSARDRRFYDPSFFRIILVDQRGAGRSKPVGEIRENSAKDLIGDFEILREQLGIDQWHLFGGSWGSTLALLYAQAHPEVCLSLVLRGIWLFREQELDWWLHQIYHLQPERWEEFASMIPEDQRDDLLEAYWRLLTGEDRDKAMAAARAWSEYEIMCCTLQPNHEFMALFDDDDVSWGLARLEAHYFRNNRLDPDDRLLRNLDRIRHLPAFIVHGRYDVVCPVAQAVELHRAWPGASLVIVEDAGHSSSEPGISRELVAATDRIRDQGTPVLDAHASSAQATFL